MKRRLVLPSPLGAATRVRYVGGAIRPVVAAWFRVSYRLLWKRRNADARSAYETQESRLDPVQDAVLAELRERGIAHVRFDALLEDPARWPTLARVVEAWVSSPGVLAAARGRRQIAATMRDHDDYLIRRHRGGGALSWDSPWLGLALEPRILGIANAYFGMMSRLYDVDLWSSIALDGAEEPIGSQRWHRDPADLKLLKVFLYFSDVDGESGALTYVPHSRRGERYGDLWPHPLFFFGSGKPPAAEVERRIPAADQVVAAHPAGTLVFVDTAGLHRGGRARSHDRMLATWAYSTQASRWRRAFRVDPASAPRGLSAAARYAVLA